MITNNEQYQTAQEELRQLEERLDEATPRLSPKSGVLLLVPPRGSTEVQLRLDSRLKLAGMTGFGGKAGVGQ